MPIQTKRAIAESFKKLLSKRGLKKITVRDIVEDCGVNRQTFYYHFHDVYDLMDGFFRIRRIPCSVNRGITGTGAKDCVL